VVKITECKKVEIWSKGVASFYVNPGVDIHRGWPLWKTLVEKIVDNVENSELSTGISLCWSWGPPGYPACIISCIFYETCFLRVCYVTVFRIPGAAEIPRKSWIAVKKRRQKPSRIFLSEKIFVENRQKYFVYHLFSNGNTFSGNPIQHQEEHHAGKS